MRELWNRRCQRCGDVLENPKSRFCKKNNGECLKADKRDKIADQRARTKKKQRSAPDCANCLQVPHAIFLKVRGRSVGIRSAEQLAGLISRFPKEIIPQLKERLTEKKAAVAR